MNASAPSRAVTETTATADLCLSRCGLGLFFPVTETRRNGVMTRSERLESLARHVIIYTCDHVGVTVDENNPELLDAVVDMIGAELENIPEG